MTINQRIQKLIDKLFNGNKRAFSSAIGVSPTVIENVVGTRKGNPSFEVIQKIVFAIENINADWLLTDRGEMLIEKDIGICGNSPDPPPGTHELIEKVVELAKKNAILESTISELTNQIGNKDKTHRIAAESHLTYKTKEENKDQS